MPPGAQSRLHRLWPLRGGGHVRHDPTDGPSVSKFAGLSFDLHGGDLYL
jgi:hypothetical protein